MNVFSLQLFAARSLVFQVTLHMLELRRFHSNVVGTFVSTWCPYTGHPRETGHFYDFLSLSWLLKHDMPRKETKDVIILWYSVSSLVPSCPFLSNRKKSSDLENNRVAHSLSYPNGCTEMATLEAHTHEFPHLWVSFAYENWSEEETNSFLFCKQLDICSFQHHVTLAIKAGMVQMNYKKAEVVNTNTGDNQGEKQIDWRWMLTSCPHQALRWTMGMKRWMRLDPYFLSVLPLLFPRVQVVLCTKHTFSGIFFRRKFQQSEFDSELPDLEVGKPNRKLQWVSIHGKLRIWQKDTHGNEKWRWCERH